MPDFESIYDQTRSLPPAERLRLAQALLNESSPQGQGEEISIGQRGLAAWTESSRGEDWSQFYPANLRKRKVG